MGCKCIISLHDCFWKILLVQWFPLFILSKGKTRAAESRHLLYIKPPKESFKWSKIVPAALGEQKFKSWIFFWVERNCTAFTFLPFWWSVSTTGLRNSWVPFQRHRFWNPWERGCNSMQDRWWFIQAVRETTLHICQHVWDGYLSAQLLELCWKLTIVFYWP